MIVNQLIFLILLAFGILITSFIIGIAGIIRDLKKHTNRYHMFLILIGITMILLIPVILGPIKDFNI